MKLTVTAMGSTPDKRNDCWGTPQPLFDWFDEWFEFDIDVCASEANHKCPVYFTEEMDGLAQDWTGSCFNNPPYSNVAAWMDKAWNESRKTAQVVCLVPSSTETEWHRTAVRRALGPDGSTVHVGSVTDHRGKEWLVLKGEHGEVWTSPYRIAFVDPAPSEKKKSGNPKGSTIFVFYSQFDA